MMMILIYVLGAYLFLCWLWGIYLAIRLYAGRRVGRVMRGQGFGPRIIRPIGASDETEVSASRSSYESETITESRAA